MGFGNSPMRAPGLGTFTHRSMMLASTRDGYPLDDPRQNDLLANVCPGGDNVPLGYGSDHPVDSLHRSTRYVNSMFCGTKCSYTCFNGLRTSFPAPGSPRRPKGCMRRRHPM